MQSGVQDAVVGIAVELIAFCNVDFLLCEEMRRCGLYSQMFVRMCYGII